MATGEGGHGLSDEWFDVKCTICTRKNRIKQAQKYCIDCKKNLCKDCVEIYIEHNEGHTLVDGHGDDEEMNVLTEKCEKHKDKLLKLYCVEHDELVCSTCVRLEHRKCDELKHIIASIEDLNKDQTVHEVPEQLKTTLQNVDSVLSAIDQHIKEMSQRERKFLKEIEEYAKRLLANIRALQRKARKEISTKHEQAASEAMAKRTICATAKTEVMKCMGDMTSAGDRKAHLFILKKKGQSMTKNVEKLCRESENMMRRVRFMFEPDWRIEDTLNKFISLVAELEKYKVASKVTIDTSVKDDSESCNVEGCCLLPDGTVLLTDGNNMRVKHVNPSDCTIKDVCHLTGQRLLGITRLSPNQVAVGTRSTSVPVVSFGDKLEHTSTKQLDHKCSRIVHSNGEMFTTYINYVYVHGVNGKLLRTICKNESGENMFPNTRGIVLNQTGDRVYVSDFNKGLICTDRTGKEVFRRSEQELGLYGAFGVCTDQRGNVLVCGYESNNVVQVTEDGRVIGEILSKADGIENPHCLCYDVDRRRLFIAGYTSKLMLYQLT